MPKRKVDDVAKEEASLQSEPEVDLEGEDGSDGGRRVRAHASTSTSPPPPPPAVAPGDTATLELQATVEDAMASRIATMKRLDEEAKAEVMRELQHGRSKRNEGRWVGRVGGGGG